MKKLLVFIFIIFLLIGCSNKNSELLNLSKEVDTKVAYLESYDKKYFNNDDLKKIDSISKKLNKLDGKDDEIIEQLQKYKKQLNEIEKRTNINVADLVTSNYIRLNDKIKNSKLKADQLVNINNFLNKYYKDIIKDNQCTMFHKNSSTCDNLKSSYDLLNEIKSYDNKYNLILKKNAEEKKKQPKNSKSNDAASNSNNSNNNTTSNVPKNKPKQQTPKKQQPVNDSSMTCSAAYAKQNELLDQKKASTVVPVGDGRCNLIIY